jgi:hypothetical protein
MTLFFRVMMKRSLVNTFLVVIIVMSCIPSHDHADSFTVVVSVASIVCYSVCFFLDRTLRGDVSNDKFSRSFSTIFLGEPFSLYLINTFALASSIF